MGPDPLHGVWCLSVIGEPNRASTRFGGPSVVLDRQGHDRPFCAPTLIGIYLVPCVIASHEVIRSGPDL
jgi:hypothetical protein